MTGIIKTLITDKRIVIAIYILFALIASLQSLIGKKTYEEGGNEYNKYNNYAIFEKSFEHLKNHQDLYVLYPDEHWDLYKYTPSFSVFFGVFHVLPDWLGLSLWNLLNALVLLFAVFYMPKLDTQKQVLILFIVLIELLTSMQNQQSNGLLAGLLVLTFGLLERNKLFWAVACIVFSMYIKIFGIVGFALFLFYPNKWKAALYTLFWMLAWFALPLLYIDVHQYVDLYASYLNLLKNDHDMSYGYSVMGWINSWFSVEFNKNIIVALGILVFLFPFVKIRCYRDNLFKILILCSILIWIVIFNHKAESPTFILAMTGVAIWFVQGEKNNLNVVLFISAMVFTSLSSTDLFPKSWREEFVKPYNLKAFPCILIWMKIIYDLLMLKKEVPSANNLVDRAS